MEPRPLYVTLVEQSRARTAAKERGKKQPSPHIQSPMKTVHSHGTRLQAKLAASSIPDPYADSPQSPEGADRGTRSDYGDVSDQEDSRLNDHNYHHAGIHYPHTVYDFPPEDVYVAEDDYEDSGYSGHGEDEVTRTEMQISHPSGPRREHGWRDSEGEDVDVETYDEADDSRRLAAVEAARQESYRRLRQAWDEQAAADAAERAAAEERLPQEYEQYMMDRLEQEHDTERAAAVQFRKAQKARRLAEKQAKVAHIAQLAREQATEKERQARDRLEASRLEREREKAEKEEREEKRNVQKRVAALREAKEKGRFRFITLTHSIHTAAANLPDQLQQEQAAEQAIAYFEEQKREYEQSLLEMRAKRAAEEQDLQRQETELQEARVRVVAKQEARIKATKDSDDHPRALAARYSRACTICLAANPRRRATLIACGHMTCAICAEQLVEKHGGSGEFPCPFCRKSTRHVKMFEDLEDAEVVSLPPPSETDTSRKRKADGVVAYKRERPSTSKDSSASSSLSPIAIITR